MLEAILPWCQPEWLKLKEALQNDRLPHALLLMGQPGLGKKKLADVLAHTVLCEKKTACGHCHSCHLWQAKSHPDFILIEPLADTQTIKIDQIRAVIESVNQTAMLNDYRVIIIHPAASMTLAAANALLKTLEEPSAKTLIILINDQSAKLPLTIKSRCQKILLKKPAKIPAMSWLQDQLPNLSIDFELLLNLSEGAPLKALALVSENQLTIREDFYQGLLNLSINRENPLDLALKWQDQNLLFLMQLLFSFLKDLLWFKLSSGEAVLINTDYAAVFAKLSIETQELVSYLNLVQQRFNEMGLMQNLNKQLLLEELLIRWTNYYVSG